MLARLREIPRTSFKCLSPKRAWANIQAKNGDLKAFAPGGIAKEVKFDNGDSDAVLFGIKDILHSKGFVTKYGSKAFANENTVEKADAAMVSWIHRQIPNAVDVGKTETVEFALYTATDTRNPHDYDRTPGGSSSGSAVAVASEMTHFAIGTQTGGSIVRPASYCGVVGLKPTFGTFPIQGALSISPSLDTVGLFTRSVSEMNSLFRDLTDIRGEARAPSKPIKVGVFMEKAVYDEVFLSQADEEARQVLNLMIDKLANRSGVTIKPIPFPETFRSHHPFNIAFYEAKRSMSWILNDPMKRPQVDQRLVARLENDILYEDYVVSKQAMEQCQREIDATFNGIDVILTLAVKGVAPKVEECRQSDFPTGDPFINSALTMFGNPCVAVPVGAVGHLPLGLQFVGKRYQDASLLSIASELVG